MLRLPQVRQSTAYDCGAAALQAVLGYFGHDVRRDRIIRLAGTGRHGTPVAGMKRVLAAYRLRFSARRMSITQLKASIDKGHPVIILLQAWSRKGGIDWAEEWAHGHYAVAIGHRSSTLFFMDPASIHITSLTEKELLRRWHDKDHGRRYVRYGIVVMATAPPRRIIPMG